MKKRIISLILVLVTLCCVLASCADYSIANEKNIASYASLKNKEDFEAALKAIRIEDADFTTDEVTRINKTWDSIYGDIASVMVKEGDKLTKDTPSANDVVYYNYYYTYTDANNVTYYFTDNMASDKSVSVMLGLRDLTDLEKQIKAVLTTTKIDDYTYTTNTVGVTKENDVVFVTYNCEYNVETTKEDGTTVTEPVKLTLTKERIVLKKGQSAFIDNLIGKDIGKTTIEDFTDDATGKKYTGIKIEYRANGNEICSAKETTYTEKKDVKDVYGNPHDLKDKELTYHVYPVNYVKVPEFSAESFVNVILDDSITFAAVTRILFGEYFNDQSEEAKNAILYLYLTHDYKVANAETGAVEADTATSITLEQLVEKLDAAQTEYATALKNKKTAESNKNTKDVAQKTAEANLAAAKPEDANYAELQTKLETAKTEATTAATALADAEKAFAAKEAIRNYYVSSLINISEANKKDGERFNLTDGYYWLTFEYLRDKYNAEIRMSLAKEVYALFAKHVELKGELPEKAVKETVDTIIDNYKYQFYNGVYNSTTKESNYSHFGGNFKNYLKEVVPNSNNSYDFAMSSIEKTAKEYVQPVVIIYAMSEAYGIRVDDKEFKEYTKDNNNYEQSVYLYGENSVRYAHQFDKLMNHLLAYEEVNGEFVYTYLGKASDLIKE